MKHLPLLLCIVLILSCVASVFAANEHLPEEIRVDRSVIEMKSGEETHIEVSFIPEDTVMTFYSVYPSREGIVEVDTATGTIKALKPGTVRLLFDSVLHTAQTSVQVIVDGGEDLEEKSLPLIDLSAEDLGKVRDGGLKNMLLFLTDPQGPVQKSAFTDPGSYRAIAKVTPGTEKAQQTRAEAAGLQSDGILSYSHMVILSGTVDEMVDYLKENPDLLSLSDDTILYIDPVKLSDDTDDGKCQENATGPLTLQGYTEELTAVSKMHDLGYYGDGQVIAVMDDAFDSGHDEFTNITGRVKNEACRSAITDSSYQMCSCNPDRSVVPDGTPGAAYPSEAARVYEKDLTHGTLVTSCAAGKGGMAPNSDIIFVGVGHVEFFDVTKDVCTGSGLNWTDAEGVSDGKRCYTGHYIWESAQLSGLEYLYGLVTSGQRIDVINVSIGGSGRSNTNKGACCDYDSGLNETEKGLRDLYKDLTNAGALVVVAAGNDGYVNTEAPSCFSAVMSVGASTLEKNKPVLTSFSTISGLNEMIAPGQEICGAQLGGDHKTYRVENGTSLSSPIVAGSAALLHEMFPRNSMREIRALIQMISTTGIIESDFRVPELDFSHIEDYMVNVPTVQKTIAGDGKLIIDCKPDADAAGFLAEYNNGTKVSIDRSSSWFVLDGLTNGQEYTIDLYEYRMFNGIKFYSQPTTVTLTPHASSEPEPETVTLSYQWHADDWDPSVWDDESRRILNASPVPVPELVPLEGGKGTTNAALVHAPFGAGLYAFKGWAETADASEPKYTKDKPIVELTDNMTLYAVWANDKENLKEMLDFVWAKPDGSEPTEFDKPKWLDPGQSREPYNELHYSCFWDSRSCDQYCENENDPLCRYFCVDFPPYKDSNDNSVRCMYLGMFEDGGQRGILPTSAPYSFAGWTDYNKERITSIINKVNEPGLRYRLWLSLTGKTTLYGTWSYIETTPSEETIGDIIVSEDCSRDDEYAKCELDPVRKMCMIQLRKDFLDLIVTRGSDHPKFDYVMLSSLDSDNNIRRIKGNAVKSDHALLILQNIDLELEQDLSDHHNDMQVDENASLHLSTKEGDAWTGKPVTMRDRLLHLSHYHSYVGIDQDPESPDPKTTFFLPIGSGRLSEYEKWMFSYKRDVTDTTANDRRIEGGIETWREAESEWQTIDEELTEVWTYNDFYDREYTDTTGAGYEITKEFKYGTFVLRGISYKSENEDDYGTVYDHVPAKNGNYEVTLGTFVHPDDPGWEIRYNPFTAKYTRAVPYECQGEVSESGSSMTVQCRENGESEWTIAGTITIAPPDGQPVYDGKAKAATLTLSNLNDTVADLSKIVGNMMIDYQKTDEEATTTDAPKNAGEYTASLTYEFEDGPKVISTTFTIGQAAGAYQAVPKPNENIYPYTGTKQTLFTEDTDENDTCVWNYCNTAEGSCEDVDAYKPGAPKERDAGSYTFRAFCKGMENYNDAPLNEGKVEPVTLTAEIPGKDPAAIAPTAKDPAPVYTGSPLDIIEPGTSTDAQCTWMYCVKGGDRTCEAKSTYGTAVPQGTDAGEYDVMAYCKGAESYRDIEPAAITPKPSVAAADPAPAEDDKPQPIGPKPKYTGEPQPLISAGTPDHCTWMYCAGDAQSCGSKADFTTAVPQGTGAGEYDVQYYCKGNTANYGDTAVTAMDPKPSIDKAAVTYSAPVPMDPQTYDGTPKDLIKTYGTVKGGKMVYAITGSIPEGAKAGETYADGVEKRTDAAVYTIAYKVQDIDTANYETPDPEIAGTVEAVIEPLDLSKMTLKLEQDIYAYTGEEIIPGLDFTGMDFLSDDVTVAVVQAPAVEPGKYTVKVAPKSGNVTAGATIEWEIFKVSPVEHPAEEEVTAGSPVTYTIKPGDFPEDAAIEWIVSSEGAAQIVTYTDDEGNTVTEITMTKEGTAQISYNVTVDGKPFYSDSWSITASQKESGWEFFELLETGTLPSTGFPTGCQNK